MESATRLAASHDPLRAFYNWDAHHYVTIARDGYFPATMGTGGSYFRFFLLPYALAALAVARVYLDRRTILGLARERVAFAVVALGFALQWGFSLFFAAHRWVG